MTLPRTIFGLMACLTISAALVSAQERTTIDDASRFGPGVVNIIDPPPAPNETYSGPLPLQEFLAKHPEIDWNPTDFPEGKPHFNSRSRTLIEKAKLVTLRREVHGFEFAFKPLRQIRVDIPQPNGLMKNKLIWYMAFRIRYRGGDLRPKEVIDNFGNRRYPEIEAVAYKKRRCFPMLVLANHIRGKEYVDRVLPTAREPIARREQINSQLYNTVEVATVNIPRTNRPDAPGVWSYATWEDVDPTTDFFSVYVYGLTNAYEIIQKGGEDTIRRKILQLNFYRPGDSVNELADDIRFGIPAFRNEREQRYILKQYQLPERLDYRWIFR